MRFDVHLGRDWAMEWLLQLIVIAAFVDLINWIASASAPISSSVYPLSL